MDIFKDYSLYRVGFSGNVLLNCPPGGVEKLLGREIGAYFMYKGRKIFPLAPWKAGAIITWAWGNDIFIRYLCGRARRLGMIFTPQGVFQNGNLIHARTEEGIFMALGIPFISHEKRNVRGNKWITEYGLPKHW